MDLGAFLIFLIIFGVVGFFLSKVIGYNLYRIFTDILAFVLVISLIIALWPAIVTPEKATDAIPNLVDVFVNNLPGIIVGDIAGTFISGITDG